MFISAIKNILVSNPQTITATQPNNISKEKALFLRKVRIEHLYIVDIIIELFQEAKKEKGNAIKSSLSRNELDELKKCFQTQLSHKSYYQTFITIGLNFSQKIDLMSLLSDFEAYSATQNQNTIRVNTYVLKDCQNLILEVKEAFGFYQ